MTSGPLAGCGVLVTRPASQAQSLIDAIERAGGKTLLMPVLDIVAAEPHDLRRETAQLAAPDIIIFVSVNAVAHGWHALQYPRAALAAIGPATRSAIEAAGATVDISPDAVFDSEHLLLHPALQDVDGKRVLIVRAQDGRAFMGDTLAKRGAAVDYLGVYRREPRLPEPAELATLDAELTAGTLHFVVAMSGDTVAALAAAVPGSSLERLRKTALVAPSARVIQTATALFPGIPTVLAPSPQASAIVDAMCRHWQDGRQA